MATVVKKNDWYYLKWYDALGKQHWKATGTKNRREANDMAKKLAEEVKFEKRLLTVNGKIPKASQPLDVLLARYREFLQKRADQGSLSSKTVENNIGYLNSFEVFLKQQGLFDKTSGHLDKDVMTKYLDFLLKYKPQSSGLSKLTPEGIALRFEGVGRFLIFIADKDNFGAPVDPKIVKIDLPKPEKPVNSDHKTLTKEQVEFLLELPLKRESYRDWLILLTLFNTGMRSGELRAFKVKDIDFRKSEIAIVGKGNKFRTVPLTERLSAELKPFVQGRKPEEYVFTVTGEMVSKAFVRDILMRYEHDFLKRYPEVKHLHPHLSRHTAVTLMLEAGIPVEVVKEVAGHSQISTTMVYTHVSRRRMKEEMRKFGV